MYISTEILNMSFPSNRQFSSENWFLLLQGEHDHGDLEDEGNLEDEEEDEEEYEEEEEEW